MIGAVVKPYLVAGGVGLAALGIGYAWGRVYGSAAGKIEQLQDTIQAHETREKIDEDVGSADRYQLCVDVGGMPDQCDELRRMEKAAKPE